MASYKEHTLDIYGADLYLATTRRQWAALRRRVTILEPKPPEAAGWAMFATHTPAGAGTTVPVLVVWVDTANHATVGELVDTCAHEAAHAASGLLEHIGHNRAGDEPHAYLVGWLTRWLWEHTRTEVGE